MTTLPSSLTAAARAADLRPAAPPARGPEGTLAFAQTLAQVRARQAGRALMSETEVRPGDTLSGIVARHLKATQPQLAPNRAQLLELALSVARDNAMANPNRLQVGQVIDLSALESRALAALQPVDPAQGLAAPAAPRAPLSAPSAFLVQHAQAARRTEAASGIPAHFMLAQAALETGWGQREIRSPEGHNSHNLFGIRAGSNWQGPTVDVWTTEYVDGAPQRVVGRFRAYASYEESFADYARLISQEPRYAQAMRSTGDAGAFAMALQKGGYATGPRYASVLKSVIDTTAGLYARVPEVRLALSGASEPQVQAAAAPPEAAWLPASQALHLRWTPIAPMPGSALAQAGKASRLPS